MWIIGKDWSWMNLLKNLRFFSKRRLIIQAFMLETIECYKVFRVLLGEDRNYDRQNEESCTQYNRCTLQEKIQSARFRFTEKMFRTTGDGTRQTSAFPVLQQYYSD